MSAGLFLARMVFSLQVIESVFLGALVFGATYVLGLAMRKGLRNARNA
jgi:hypothetical protein